MASLRVALQRSSPSTQRILHPRFHPNPLPPSTPRPPGPPWLPWPSRGISVRPNVSSKPVGLGGAGRGRLRNQCGREHSLYLCAYRAGCAVACCCRCQPGCEARAGPGPASACLQQSVRYTAQQSSALLPPGPASPASPPCMSRGGGGTDDAGHPTHPAAAAHPHPNLRQHRSEGCRGLQRAGQPNCCLALATSRARTSDLRLGPPSMRAQPGLMASRPEPGIGRVRSSWSRSTEWPGWACRRVAGGRRSLRGPARKSEHSAKVWGLSAECGPAPPRHRAQPRSPRKRPDVAKFLESNKV